MLRIILGFLIVLSVSPAHTGAQTGTNQAQGGAIQGTVLDPNGNPVSEARVSLLTPTTALTQVRSGDRGQYSFADLSAGTYFIAASSPGLSFTTGEVDLRAEETRRLDIPLQLSVVEQRIVVSASFGDVLASNIGSSVGIVSERDIESRGAQSVLEVLRGVPGVEVNQTGRRGGVTGVFIRGGESDYNVVMVDGVQLNQFGGAFDVAPLGVDGVTQVEVIRGSQSALYGSSSLAGVINLVSRRGEGPPSFTLGLEGGSFDTRRFATGGSGLYRGFRWSYDLSRLTSAGVVTNDRYRNQTAFLNLGFSRSPRRELGFHFFGNANDAGAPGAFGSDPGLLFGGIDTVSRNKQNIFGYQASHAEQFSARFRQVTTVSVAENRYAFHSSFGDSFSKNLRIIGNTRSEVILAPTDLLVVGFEYNREQIKNSFIAGPDNNPFVLPRTSLAYFVENRWSPANRWSIIAGVRVDHIRTHEIPPDAFGSRPLLPASSEVKTNPRGSVAYLLHRAGTQATWGTTRLHGSAGTGIRAPDGFELAFTDNPRLRPETSISTDAGVEQRLFRDRAAVDITYFYNRFKDQIVVLGGSLQDLSTFSSANLANASTRGVELALRLQLSRNLRIAVEYTRLDTAILALDGTALAQTPFQVGQPLIRRPRNSGGYDVTWQRGRLLLNTTGYVRGPVLDIEPNAGTFACTLGLPCLFRNKGYVLANAGFSFRLARGIEFHGRLNNLLNQKYEESLGFPALHLNFLTGIRFQFPAERTVPN